MVELVQERLILLKQYLKLYQDQEQEHKQDQDIKDLVEHDRRSIIIVCKDERDWIIPETGKTYSDFNICGINMITSKNVHVFHDSVIVLHDMGKS